MKVNKIALIALFVILVGVLTPKLSVSQDADPETISLSADNTLVLNSEVNGESTSKIISLARELDAKASRHEYFSKKKPFYLFLNTPGGSIQSGLEMIEALKGLGRKVNTISLFAASMGFQIVQNLDTRLVLKSGTLMAHHATGGFEGSFGGVHPSQVDSRYQMWLDRIRELDEQTVKRTNGKQTYESYTSAYDHEFWLGGNQSVAKGYADKVVMVKCDSSLKGSTTFNAEFMGLIIAYDLDNCPINTSPMNVRLARPENNNLSNEIMKDIKARFVSQFDTKQKQVVPMYW